MRIISRRILFFSLVAGAPITGVVAQQHINHELAPNIDVTSFQISPDDCRAVYQTNRRHSGPIGGEVYTVLIGGGTATRIGDDRNYKYTINPNGNTVLYSDSRRVYSTPILGGATTEIVCTPTFPGPSASRKPGLRKQFTSSNRSLHPQNQHFFITQDHRRGHFFHKTELIGHPISSTPALPPTCILRLDNGREPAFTILRRNSSAIVISGARQVVNPLPFA